MGATIVPVVTVLKDGNGQEYGRQVQWGPMANSDVGAPFSDPHFADCSVQVGGTLGAGGNCRIEGSNIGAPPATLPGAGDWATLNDSAGIALNIGAAGIKEILEVTLWKRPNITAGDGTTAITVTLMARRK